MSIQNEINRIVNAKQDVINVLYNKGIEIPYNLTIDSYVNYLNELESQPLDKEYCVQVYSNLDDPTVPSISYYLENEEYYCPSMKAFNVNNFSLVNIGSKVANISNLFDNCFNLTGSPVCGNNVVNMYRTYSECSNLTGSPVCGVKVENMYATYFNCQNIKGNPVCGDNVTDMRSTYMNCRNITGSPVCGNNVTIMYQTYVNCIRLTGPAVCGPNVTDMNNAYRNCVIALQGNAYFYSPNVSNVLNCFNNKYTNRRLNLYVPANSTTLDRCLVNGLATSLFGVPVTWNNQLSTNGYYFNSVRNIYIYPVDNVAAAREANND